MEKIKVKLKVKVYTNRYLSSQGSGPSYVHPGKWDSGSQPGDAPCQLQPHLAGAGRLLAARISSTPSFTFLCCQTKSVELIIRFSELNEEHNKNCTEKKVSWNVRSTCLPSVEPPNLFPRSYCVSLHWLNEKAPQCKQGSRLPSSEWEFTEILSLSLSCLVTAGLQPPGSYSQWHQPSTYLCQVR